MKFKAKILMSLKSFIDNLDHRSNILKSSIRSSKDKFKLVPLWLRNKLMESKYRNQQRIRNINMRLEAKTALWNSIILIITLARILNNLEINISRIPLITQAVIISLMIRNLILWDLNLSYSRLLTIYKCLL